MILVWLTVCFFALLVIASVHNAVNEYLCTCFLMVVVFTIIESTNYQESDAQKLAAPLSTYIAKDSK